MRFLVVGDLHLKPGGDSHELEDVAVPDEVDVAIILGDLTHRAGPDDIELARRFVERLETEVPVVYVPGNHDPSPTEERVIEPLQGAYSGHCAVYDSEHVTIVGKGCEQRSLSPAIDQRSFDALDSRDVPHQDRRYAADQVADDLEAACLALVREDATRSEIADSLGITDSERSAFDRGLARIEEEYEQFAELLGGCEDILLATHLPPFNTSFDRHHSVGARETDQEFLHTGSIALKLAIRDHDVFAAFSGHSHAYGYDVGTGVDGRPHLLNLGFSSMATVTASPDDGQFTFTRLNEKTT